MQLVPNKILMAANSHWHSEGRNHQMQHQDTCSFTYVCWSVHTSPGPSVHFVLRVRILQKYTFLPFLFAGAFKRTHAWCACKSSGRSFPGATVAPDTLASLSLRCCSCGVCIPPARSAGTLFGSAPPITRAPLGTRHFVTPEAA